ncbi:MAG TPA: hypothetical protein VJS91_10405 [Nitrososphaeraceae archaeon]|nr:hypothetical protein [Nitrososphaeraceae archaeon]
MTMQYTYAQNIIQLKEPGKIEIPNLNNPPPTNYENEPTVKGEVEPEIEGEESRPQKEEPSGVDVNEDKPETKGEEESEEDSTFTCMSDSVDLPTKANCTITNGGVSTSYDCNADATTKIWSCVKDTATSNTDKSTLIFSMTKTNHETLKGVIQNLRG